ncbi:MAG: PAS domain-containing protein [Muribaculaceae bacterium]|nr:PAS domain-containing protein [Muribaculaceae bacterium]MDE7096618.1 PAS domain-containing protein [Muribaculaceae bacterium]
MRISWIFSLIAILILGAVMALMLLDPGSVSYTIVWGMALVGTVLLVVFYRNVMRPLRTIANGIDLLRAQDFSSRLSHVGQREADRIVDMFNGMMGSLKHERLKLREQNHFLDLLIDVSPMGILLLGSDGKVTGCNKAAVRFLGQDSPKELTGLTPDVLDTPLGRVLATLADKEVKVVRLNDSMVYRCSRLSFMESGIAHPFYLIEKLTDEVMKAERKSYEKVIRMMAHEVNNSLAGIISVMETAEEEVADADLKEAIAACEDRCRDMGAFITKFASAVKIPEPVKVNVDLAEMLSGRLPILESICSATGSRLEMKLPDREVPVFVDPVLIEQVVTNIVKNAAESAGEGGTVSIAIESPGTTLVVTDNGPGISAEAAEMLFTPFFTTKESGHGLGLLLVSEVLNSHGCRFSLETCSDSLTRFRIRF